MTDAIFIAGLFLCTLASFYFSGVETGIYTMNRVRLRVRAGEGDAGAKRALALVSRPQILISTILIGNHVANFGATFFSQGLVRDVLHAENPEMLNTLLLTPFLFVFGELTPKNVFRLRANRLVCRTSGILVVAGILFRPLAHFLRWLGHLSGALPRRVPGSDAVLSRDRLKKVLGEVAEEGVLTQEQRRMLENVMRISGLPVGNSMVRLPEVDLVEEGFSRADLIRVSARHGRTRLPVRSAGDGRFLGVVSVLDLVFQEGDELHALVHDIPRIPSTYSVERSLRVLRQARRTMGLVIDQEGADAGIVTVKDLVEEVSGELPVF